MTPTAPSRAPRVADTAYRSIVCALLLAWALAGTIALIAIASDPTGPGGTLTQLKDLLPSDPWLWSGFTA